LLTTLETSTLLEELLIPGLFSTLHFGTRPLKPDLFAVSVNAVARYFSGAVRFDHITNIA
jgi:hypothetical protein